MKKTQKRTITVLILAIVSGALAGVFSSVMTNQSLERYAQSLRSNERIFQISEVKPEPVPGTYEEALSRIQESVWSSIAFVTNASSDTSANENWITRKGAVAQGAVITSDGWLLFHKDTFASYRNPLQQSEVWLLSQRYAVEEIVEDTRSDFVLVKIDAHSLSSFAFGRSEEMKGGEIIFALTGFDEVMPISLRNSDALLDEITLPAESFISFWELSQELSSPSVLVNSRGDLIGFSDDAFVAAPFHHLFGFIQSVLRDGELQYAGLGTEVVHLQSVLNLDEFYTDQTSAGALVLSVASSSAASKAGITIEDIIVAVDDVVISQTKTLAEILTQYSAGEGATIKLIRNGEEIEVEVTFENAEDLVY
jgi:S1-C subfamily serine protease